MRLQLALNVHDLDAAVDFYSRMFGVAPAKLKPGYANFAIDEPPLKLVLFEEPDAPGTPQPPRCRGVRRCRRRRRPRTRQRRRHPAFQRKRHHLLPRPPEQGLGPGNPDGLRWEWYRVIEDVD